MQTPHPPRKSVSRESFFKRPVSFVYSRGLPPNFGQALGDSLGEMPAFDRYKIIYILCTLGHVACGVFSSPIADETGACQ